MSTPGLKQFDTERDLRSFLDDSGCPAPNGSVDFV